ncbi:hypothetical protein ACFL02_09665 [Planctomycetota bacterium]
MKVEMTVSITKPGGGIELVRKEVDLPFAPNIGMEIECAAWKSQRKVKNVTLSFDQDYEEAYLNLYMGKDETNNEEEQKKLVEMYKEHGWILVGE